MRFVHFSEYKAIIFLNNIHRMACTTGIKFIGPFWINMRFRNNKNQVLLACSEYVHIRSKHVSQPHKILLPKNTMSLTTTMGAGRSAVG